MGPKKFSWLIIFGPGKFMVQTFFGVVGWSSGILYPTLALIRAQLGVTIKVGATCGNIKIRKRPAVGKHPKDDQNISDR